MANFKGHYKSFDVMDAKEHWDPETQAVVAKRLQEYPLTFLTEDEAKTLYRLCSILMGDDRKPIIQFVIHHFDSMLHTDIGEAQRKATVPKQTKLIREGLVVLDQSCLQYHDKTFLTLPHQKQLEVVKGMMEGVFLFPDDAKNIPMLDFIHKVMQEATSAYYSHPVIWSEIGYAGPAYPRGYVRIQLGLTDPWEARKDV